MSKRIRNRLGITLVVAVAAVVLFAGFPPRLENISNKIRLGLDLKGGTHLVMAVVTEDAIRAETDLAIERMEELLSEENVLFRQSSRVADNQFQFVGVDPSRDETFRDLLSEQFPEWNVISTVGDVPNTYTMGLESATAVLLRDQAVTQAIQTIRNRIDQLGVTEPVIQEYGGPGEYEILVQLPGVDDPERVKDIVQSTALLELKLVESGPFADEQSAKNAFGGALPANMEAVQSAEADLLATWDDAWYVVERVAAITGRDLKPGGAYTQRDQNGRPAVGFSLTADGADRFARVTEQNIGRPLAIILDGRVMSAPTIESRIAGSGQITGGAMGFTQTEAADLALILRSGALPASLEYQEERTVSASLGADSIRQGIIAGGASLAVVVLFMLFYYRLSGVNAALAMVLNILILFGALAYFQATLTLPGIAGIILTIGVGIDSNILIFERIREELRAGKTAVSSVVTGFNRVFITIVDTHLAAMISAAFLFMFGTGPVKGFAVTLMIGLIANVFTAVFVSRSLFEWYLGRRERVATLSI
jgi:preprotein translocase subunit SecD